MYKSKKSIVDDSKLDEEWENILSQARKLAERRSGSNKNQDLKFTKSGSNSKLSNIENE